MVKHRETDKILGGIYFIPKGFPTKNPPVFVALGLDLKKISSVDLNKIDGAVSFREETHTK